MLSNSQRFMSALGPSESPGLSNMIFPPESLSIMGFLATKVPSERFWNPEQSTASRSGPGSDGCSARVVDATSVNRATALARRVSMTMVLRLPRAGRQAFTRARVPNLTGYIDSTPSSAISRRSSSVA